MDAGRDGVNPQKEGRLIHVKTCQGSRPENSENSKRECNEIWAETKCSKDLGIERVT